MNDIFMAMYANSTAAQIAVLTILSSFAMADLVGNILVCVVVLRNRRMRTPMNIIVSNLALCDITVALGMISKYILTKLFHHPTGEFGRYLCTFITSGNLTWVGGLASVFCLVSLAYERYSAIINPYDIHKRTSKGKAKLLCLFAWISSIVICIPEFLGHSYSKEKEVCIQKWPTVWLPKAYSMFWMFIVGIIPSSLLVYYYSRIVYSLWIRASHYPLAQQAVLKYRKGVTKMLIIISVIYIVGWLPTLFVFVLVYWHRGYQVGQVIGAVTAILVVFNSAVNPYVYALQSKDFRRQLKRYIVCFCCHGEIAPISSFPKHSGIHHFPNMELAGFLAYGGIELRSFQRQGDQTRAVNQYQMNGHSQI